MKKVLIPVLSALFSFTLLADHDLAAKDFVPVNKEKLEIVSGESWFSKALKLSAGKDAPAMARYEKVFPFDSRWEYEVSCEIKGNGMAFIILEFLDQDGTILVSQKISGREAAGRFRDLEGKFDAKMWRARRNPAGVRVVLCVEKGGSVIFDDVEFDIDRD